MIRMLWVTMRCVPALFTKSTHEKLPTCDKCPVKYCIGCIVWYACCRLFNSHFPRVFLKHSDHRKRGKMQSTIVVNVLRLPNQLSYQLNGLL